MSVECQVNVKSQSELDIGGRETCLDTPMRCLCSRQLCNSASKMQKLEKITSILLALCVIVKNLFIRE